MKDKINDILLSLQTNEIDVGEAANKLLDLFEVSGSSEIEKEITRLQEKYDENGYEYPSIIKLQRIEAHVDAGFEIYQKICRLAQVPEIIIDDPYILERGTPTKNDIEWGKSVFKDRKIKDS